MHRAEHSSCTVVVTSYGVGERIERAVTSILEQTLAGNEVVVVDDASQDASTISSLARLPQDIPIHRIPERRGAAAARNLGLALTTQPYVLCLDGDDWVDPAYLERAREIFERHPDVGIVSAWVRFEGDRHGEWKPEPFELADLLAANRISAASIFRREASQARGHYDEALGGYEDWEHWIAIMAAGWQTAIIPEVMIHYEWRPDSLGRASDADARRITERIVARHRELYRDRIDAVFPKKHERAVALEAEAREAWERGRLAEEELQRAWRLVEDLRGRIGSFRDLERELQRAWQLVKELSSKLEGQAGCYQDLQRTWQLVAELGQKLEMQQRAIEALNQELTRMRRRAGEIESGEAPAPGGGDQTGSPAE